jgi:alanyl aminopeptidase
LLGALGATFDGKLGEQARDYGLTPAVQVGEMFSLYRAQLGVPENRAAFWVWYKAHFDAFRDRLPPGAQSSLPKIAAFGRCTSAQADELQEWFAPRIEHLIGGDRGLAQALEGVNQCSSLREHVGEKALTEWAEAHRAN